MTETSEGSAAGIAQTTRIVAGAITFRRPESLQVLLESMRDRLDVGPYQLDSLTIVDNDPERSAEDVVSDFGKTVAFDVHYVVQPRPGISAARNALVEAAGDADWLTMVDDDEIIVDGWPAELVRVGIENNATIVAGPVEADLGPGAHPSWFNEPIFFGRSVFEEGQHVDHVPSGNCAIHLERARAVEGDLFDERFGLTGGSDSFLSQRVLKAGGRNVFAPGAITREMYPSDRVNLKWLNRRWKRNGQTLVAIEGAIGNLDTGEKAKVAVKAGVRFLTAAGLLATAAWQQPRLRQLWAANRQFSLAIGTLRGLSGWQPNSYGPSGTETANSATKS